jgi:hypothetical protein
MARTDALGHKARAAAVNQFTAKVAHSLSQSRGALRGYPVKFAQLRVFLRRLAGSSGTRQPCGQQRPA